MLSSRFSLFGGGGDVEKLAGDSRPNSRYSFKDQASSICTANRKPILRLQTDKNVYRPGDAVLVTIEIVDPNSQNVFENVSLVGPASDHLIYHKFIIERLGFELKGIEKLDTQWFVTAKLAPGSKEKRGEYVFMDGSTSSLVSNQILPSGASKTYLVRTVLPNVLPPSYRGATIRYLYFVKCTLYGRWLVMENEISHGELGKDVVDLEVRCPLQIWVSQKNNGLVLEECQSGGIVPASTINVDLFWKEMNGDSEWLRANEKEDETEEGYESSHDEVSSVSSYNISRGGMNRTFGSSMSLQSSGQRLSVRDSPYAEGVRRMSSLSLTQLSVTDVLHDSSLVEGVSPIKHPYMKIQSEDEKAGSVLPSPRAERNELAASEGFLRGRSYNIKMDDQVLLRFSPKNSDSTYYFSDTIGGTLSFSHDENARRCLEVSITLETSEAINPYHVHPSRRNSPTITKVQSDHHEVVADLIQTSFLFSIPLDGPMSFSTPHVSVQWVLRFEFFTTPKNVDWKRYEHPLLIDGRDKSEWVLPIVVHAPPVAATTSNSRNDKPFSLEPLWVPS